MEFLEERVDGFESDSPEWDDPAAGPLREVKEELAAAEMLLSALAARQSAARKESLTQIKHSRHGREKVVRLDLRYPTVWQHQDRYSAEV